MKNTFDNTQIYPIDVKALAEFFETPEPCEIKTFDGIIFEPKVGITSDEMVLWPADDSQSFKIDLYPADRKDEDGTTHISIFPKWTATVSADEIRNFTNQPVSLAEFTKGRRGYNRRLESNEREIVRWLNGEAK